MKTEPILNIIWLCVAVLLTLRISTFHLRPKSVIRSEDAKGQPSPISNSSENGSYLTEPTIQEQLDPSTQQTASATQSYCNISGTDVGAESLKSPISNSSGNGSNLTKQTIEKFPDNNIQPNGTTIECSAKELKPLDGKAFGSILNNE